MHCQVPAQLTCSIWHLLCSLLTTYSSVLHIQISEGRFIPSVYTTRGACSNVEIFNWSVKYSNKAVTYRIQLESAQNSIQLCSYVQSKKKLNWSRYFINIRNYNHKTWRSYIFQIEFLAVSVLCAICTKPNILSTYTIHNFCTSC